MESNQPGAVSPPQNGNKPLPTPRRNTIRFAQASVALCLLLLTVTFCTWFLLDRMRAGAKQTALDAADIFKTLVDLTPQVRITSFVSVQKTSKILELATVKKEFKIPYQYKATFAGSTKELDILGDYTVKAGFDLRDDFNLDIDEQTRVVHASFPRPKIVSVQLDNFAIQSDENGYWNKITSADREAAVNDMNRIAHDKAMELGAIKEAEDSLRSQIETLSKPKSQKWEIRFRDR
jgi:hypothetical protein